MREIEIEFKKNGKIESTVIDISLKTTLSEMVDMARQLRLKTHSNAARVSVGNMTSVWVTPFDNKQ